MEHLRHWWALAFLPKCRREEKGVGVFCHLGFSMSPPSLLMCLFTPFFYPCFPGGRRRDPRGAPPLQDAAERLRKPDVQVLRADAELDQPPPQQPLTWDSQHHRFPAHRCSFTDSCGKTHTLPFFLFLFFTHDSPFWTAVL